MELDNYEEDGKSRPTRARGLKFGVVHVAIHSECRAPRGRVD